MNNNSKKLAFAGLLCGLCVVGSFITFPILASKCAPIQHFVNVLCAVLLGRYYGLGVAFSASIIRNILSLGSLLAFPGSMVGAFLSGILYHKTKSIWAAVIGEILGTGIIGALLAYPIARAFMGVGAELSFYVYVVPFLISTVAGAIIAGILATSLDKMNVLSSMKGELK